MTEITVDLTINMLYILTTLFITIPLGSMVSFYMVSKYLYVPYVKNTTNENERYEEETRHIYEQLNYIWKYPLHRAKNMERIMNKNTYVSENTPQGIVFMAYDNDEEGFVYWADKNIDYKYLEVVARKYVTMFHCRNLYKSRNPEQELMSSSDSESGSNDDDNNDNNETTSEEVHERQREQKKYYILDLFAVIILSILIIKQLWLEFAIGFITYYSDGIVSAILILPMRYFPWDVQRWIDDDEEEEEEEDDDDEEEEEDDDEEEEEEDYDYDSDGRPIGYETGDSSYESDYSETSISSKEEKKEEEEEEEEKNGEYKEYDSDGRPIGYETGDSSYESDYQESDENDDDLFVYKKTTSSSNPSSATATEHATESTHTHNRVCEKRVIEGCKFIKRGKLYEFNLIRNNVYVEPRQKIDYETFKKMFSQVN
jgi:hypothetical protein